MKAIGVDGAPGGWIAAARHEDGSTSLRFEAEAERCIAAADCPVAIDMPIGLPEETSYRACDEKARERLKHADRALDRRSSVFMPPGRYLLDAAAPRDGKARTAREVFTEVQVMVAARGEPGSARGLSQQGSGILSRIREVDELLRSDQADPESVAEVHPELCFLEMAGGALASKTSARGQLRRLELVDEAFDDALATIKGWYGSSRHSLIDILDAYAALWTAERIGAGAVELGDGDRDDYGLPMRMLI